MEAQFLTTYGLRGYVSYKQSLGVTVFTIAATESPKMIAHARALITEVYAGASTVQVS